MLKTTRLAGRFLLFLLSFWRGEAPIESMAFFSKFAFEK